MSHSLVQLGIFYTWPINNMVIVPEEVKRMCGVIFNKCIHAIYLLQPMSSYVQVSMLKDSNILFYWLHVTDLFIFGYSFYNI